jgi:HAD superfamily hydrolase (TIGR01509 family)
MPLHVSRIRALIFDVDGTLSDTDDLFVQKLEPVLRPFRFLFRNRDTRQAARRLVMWSEAPGNILLGIPDTLGLDGKISAGMHCFNRRRSPPQKDFLLIPGVKKMLQGLSARYPLAIVSVRDENTTRLFLDHFGLTPFFQVIVTGQTVEHTKPYPDPVFFAARALAVPPDACLMIGDTTVDIRAGKAAGAQTVGVLCGFGEELELRRCGADMILDTTPELVHVLAGW